MLIVTQNIRNLQQHGDCKQSGDPRCLGDFGVLPFKVLLLRKK